jgi:hypothetical protein
MTYKVYVCPASGVGGFWPRPARITKIKKVAERYASACRAIGQKTSVRRCDDRTID